MIDHAEHSEARLLLRYAAQDLSPVERSSVEGFAHDISQGQIAARIGLTKGGVFYAEKRAFRKMRQRLKGLGIHSTDQVLSKGEAWPG